MRASDSPYLADWFVISLRWAALVGVCLALGFSGAATWQAAGLVLVSAVWNLYVSLLALQNRRLNQHRLINVLMDGAISFLLFISTGGLNGPLLWVSLLALLSASMYFEVRGVMLAAVVLSALHAGWTLLQMRPLDPIVLILLAGINLVVGLVLGVLSLQLIHWLRGMYRRQVELRHENVRRVQLLERSRVQTMYQMIETLSSTLNYQVVLDSALDLCASAIGKEEAADGKMASAVLLFDEDQLQIGASRGISARDARMTFSPDRGVLSEAIRSGRPQMLKTAGADPELGKIAVLSSSSVLCLPLQRGIDTFGVMVIAHTGPDFFNTDRCELLQMISQQAVIAIQNARMFQDLELDKERIIDSQEEARKKLARDLHDGPAQSVAAIAMRISLARKMLDRDPVETAAEMQRVEDLARQTTQEIRHMLFTLRPLVLETEGLEAALQAIGEKMRELYQQNVVVDVDPQVVEQMEINKQSATFSLAEEAVTNARKHAQASEITIRLKSLAQDPAIAVLEVSDNGVGFDLASVQNSYDRRGSLGMVNLRERTELINGVLNIESQPGKGTRVQIFIPLNEEAADRLQRGLAGT